MTASSDLFTGSKPIIGVIHLPALPGYAGSPGLDGTVAASFVMIGADGISADRLEPTAHAVAGLQAPLAVVQPESMDLGVEAAAVWTYPSDVSELLSPIVTAVPLELLAHSLAAALDRHPFDYDNATRRSISEKTIYRDGESAQVISRRNQPGAQ